MMTKIPQRVFYVTTQEAAHQARKADATRRAYTTDWRHFTAWCRVEGRRPLPTTTDTVVDYLTACVWEGLHRSTITRRLSGIAHHHQDAGHPSPTREAAVREHWQGLRRILADQAPDRMRARKARALRAEELRAILNRLDPSRPRDARDRLLLLLGLLCSLRRSEVVALDVEDVRVVTEGLEVTLRRSMTDQEGDGHVWYLPYGADPALCPVRAFTSYVIAEGLTSGPLFPGQGRTGRLTDRSVTMVLQHRARAAGVDLEGLSGHSLRAGGITHLALRGLPEWSIQRQSRHRTLAILRDNIRPVEGWQDTDTLRALTL